MSTLKVTNIQATGETASRAVSGVAAAWVNFDGTGTIASRDSMNVSSLTDYNTGQYGVTFSSSFSSNDYAISAISTWNVGSSSSTTTNLNGDPGYTPTASLYNTLSYRTNDNASFDPAFVLGTVHGDLA